MRPKNLYLGLCLIGTVLLYSQFVPFLRENGLDARAFLDQLFATHFGGFFGWDVIISSVVLWVMVAVEGRCRSQPLVGSDCGQPGGRLVAGAPAVPLHAGGAA
jgi:hypothetical protein